MFFFIFIGLSQFRVAFVFHAFTRSCCCCCWYSRMSSSSLSYVCCAAGARSRRARARGQQMALQAGVKPQIHAHTHTLCCTFLHTHTLHTLSIVLNGRISNLTDITRTEGRSFCDVGVFCGARAAPFRFFLAAFAFFCECMVVVAVFPLPPSSSSVPKKIIVHNSAANIEIIGWILRMTVVMCAV